MSRRWPSSSSGSRPTRRLAASTAPPASPVASRAAARRSSKAATERSARTARAACQSSKAGLSRNAKPARNGPRARIAAASRSAVRVDAASRSNRPGPPSSSRGRSRPVSGRCRSRHRRWPSAAPRGSGGGRRGRPRRPPPARTSPRARRARTACPRPPPGPRSRAPCECRRSAAGRPPRSGAVRAGGSTATRRGATRRNGTGPRGNLVTLPGRWTDTLRTWTRSPPTMPSRQPSPRRELRPLAAGGQRPDGTSIGRGTRGTTARARRPARHPDPVRRRVGSSAPRAASACSGSSRTPPSERCSSSAGRGPPSVGSPSP